MSEIVRIAKSLPSSIFNGSFLNIECACIDASEAFLNPEAKAAQRADLDALLLGRLEHGSAIIGHWQDGDGPFKALKAVDTLAAILITAHERRRSGAS